MELYEKKQSIKLQRKPSFHSIFFNQTTESTDVISLALLRVLGDFLEKIYFYHLKKGFLMLYR